MEVFYMKFKKRMSIFLVLLLLLSMLLAACSQDIPDTPDVPETTASRTTTTAPAESQPEEIVLRVLTDEAPGAGYMMTMEKAISKVINDFEAKHENVVIELEYLPADEAARTKALAQVLDEIVDGNGPDVFLLSAGEITSNESRMLDVTLEPLSSKMPVFLARGIFADLAEYYDADTSLNKDALIHGVMDAGMVNDARYVIPLRYNFPVAYVDMAKFAETGLSTDIFSTGGVSMIRALAEKEVAVSVEHGSAVLASLVADSSFAEGKLRDQLAQYQALLPYLGSDGLETNLSRFVSLNGEPEVDFYWGNDGYCMQISTLETAIDQTVIAQAVGMDLGMFPVSNLHGAVVADITFYGAVNADCAHADLAYAFISGFLSEDVQWEKNLTANGVPLGSLLMADGYPVLRTGSVEALFDNMNRNQKNTDIQAAVNALEINDEDVTVLSENLPGRFRSWTDLQLQRAVADITVDTTADELAELAKTWSKK